MDVSVIIPFYKGNKYINNVLRMLKENAEEATGISIEAIVVNDSPDVKITYNEKMIDGYKLTILCHAKNMGIQQARITGIKAASGRYVFMLDQDDEIMPTTIKSQFEHIGDKSAILANGYNENIGGNRTKLYKTTKQMSVANDFSYYFYFGNMIASPGLCLIRKDKIPEKWMSSVMTINGADDWLLWVLFLNEGNLFAINNELLYVHKNDGQNTSNNEKKMLDSSQEALDIVKDEHISKKLLRVYHRRLKMRKNYLGKGTLMKNIQYIVNPDIFLHVLIYNKLM